MKLSEFPSIFSVFVFHVTLFLVFLVCFLINLLSDSLAILKKIEIIMAW